MDTQRQATAQKKYLIGLLLCALGFLSPFLALTSEEPTTSDLDTAVNKLISQYGLKDAQIGIKIVRLSDGKTIYQRNAETPLIPASNMKLLTTATALCLLGPDFLYETTLYRHGAILDNILKGDLIIRSNGNPSISGWFYNGNPTEVFEDWGKRLRNLGVKEIRGNIIIDDTAFDRQYLVASWPRDQLSYHYCAPVSAISFNNNCISITVWPDKKTGEVKYRLSPDTKYVTVINRVQAETKKSRHWLDISREAGTNNIVIKGRCWQYAEPETEVITVKNPGLYFGTVLKETLVHKKGIPVFGQVVLSDKTYDPKEDHLVELASVKTDLLTIINITNKKSQNFYAEQILKTIGYRFLGKGTIENGRASILKFLTKEIKVSLDGLNIADGSGLSRENRISPAQLVGLLVYLDKHKYGEQFRKTLPTNGEEGSLKWRLNGSDHKGKVFAKTGYINGVIALSGYLANNQAQYAFSIILNNSLKPSRAKEFQDALLHILLKTHY